MPPQIPIPPSPELIRIDLKPGINRELTRYAGEGGWYDCDMVRFRYGKPEKIGGWVNIQGTGVSGSVLGYARNIIGWNDLTGQKWMGIGTNEKLYVWEGGTYSDITPVAASISSTNIFTTQAGSTTVIVSLTGYQYSTGDFVDFTSVTTTIGGNVVISGGYQLTYIGSGSFSIDAGVTAAATSAAAGGPVTGFYELAVGPQSNTPGTGWGAGSWGVSTWGTPRASNIIIPLRTWSFDTWGQDLVANPRSGGIYIWNPTSGVDVRAALVTGAPSRADFILVSPEDRHMIAFGVPDTVTSVYTPLYIRWCSQEDYNDWAPSPTNDAGDKLLSGANHIAAVLRSRGQILIWTDTALFSMQQIGPPYTFGFQTIGQNCGIVGPNAVIDAGGRTYWMGDQKFQMYTGAAPVTLPCTVLRYVFDNLDTTQLDKVFAASNAEFNEVTWFYQSKDSTTGDIDRCVTYNYVEDLWSIGTLSRTCWLDKGVFEAPIGFGLNGVGYYQETGFDADGAAMDSFVQSNEFDLGHGQDIMFLDRIIPDQSNRNGNPLDGHISFYISYRMYPGSPAQTKGPYLVSAGTRKVDVRVRGRQMSYLIESDGLGQSWRLGSVRFRQAPDGQR